jgi:D-alanyl-D-alanine carboxypeptidase
MSTHSKIIGFIIMLSVAGFLVSRNVASVSLPTSEAVPEITAPLPTNLTTDTWGVFDTKIGKVLYGNNIDKTMPIASVTKLFTAYAVIQSERKDVAFTITESDIRTEGRSGKLEFGEKVTPYQLLFPLLIESSNDAGEAIRRKLGDEFPRAVSTVKEELALKSTTITDATGLSNKNVSTVYDLALLFAYLKRTEPHLVDITSLKNYIQEDTGYINNNPLRTFASYTGGKHGYTESAGRTFVGTFEVGKDGKEIGIVLLKSADLKADVEHILSSNKSI